MGPQSPDPNGSVTEEERPSPLLNSSSTTTIGTTLWSSSSANPHPLSIGQDCWVVGERVTREVVLRVLRPTVDAEQRRRAVIAYVRRLVRDCVGGEVFTFGSVPLRTYLPDGDIDLTSVSGQKTDDKLAMEVHAFLEREAQNNAMEFDLKDVHYIDAEVKLVKCVVQNIVVDISFNQIGGLCTLGFLERVNQFIGKDHIFKCSIILIKAWCYYESRILGAYHGLISTYALEIMVLHIFNLFHSSLNGPLAVLYRFLDYYSKFDWENYCVSINGPVSVSFLPEIIAETPENDGDQLLLTGEFLQSCINLYTAPPRRGESNQKPFSRKYLNIVDPMKYNNNLGRSVNKGSSYRIRAAFSYGARQLGRILSMKEENIGDELTKFFSSTLERHKNDYRADLQGNLPTNCGYIEFVPSFPKPEFGEYRWDEAASSSFTNSRRTVEDMRVVPQQLLHEGTGNIGILGAERIDGMRIGDEPQRHTAHLQFSTGMSIGNEPQRHFAHFQSSPCISMGNEPQRHLQSSPGMSIGSEPQRHSANFQSSTGISMGNEPQRHSVHLQLSPGISLGNEPQRHSAHHQPPPGISIGNGPQRHSVLHSSPDISTGNEPQRRAAHHQSSTGTRIGNEMQRHMRIGNEPQRHSAQLHSSPGISAGNELQGHSAHLQSSTSIGIVSEPAHHQSSTGTRIGNEMQRHTAHLQPPPGMRIGNEPQWHTAHLQPLPGMRIGNEPQGHSAHLQSSPGIGMGNEPQWHTAHLQSSSRLLRTGDHTDRNGFSGSRVSGNAEDLASRVQNMRIGMEIPQSPSPMDDRLIFGTVAGPDHAPHFYHSNGFSEAGKFENMTNNQIVPVNSLTPEGNISGQFPQLPNDMYSHVLQQDAKDLEFVHPSENFLSNPPRHLPFVECTNGFLRFHHPITNPLDNLAYSLGEMSIENLMAGNPLTMNPELDLSGDPHAHFQHLHFAIWCRDNASSAPYQQAPPLLLSQPQNRSSWDNLQQPTPMNGGMSPFPNNIHQAPPFYPENHSGFPPAGFGGEEVPRTRGLGTYFPNLNHRFHKEKVYGRGKYWTLGMHAQSHRRTPSRDRISQDKNLHTNTRQEHLEADTPVSHGRGRAMPVELTKDISSPMQGKDSSSPTKGEISLDNDNLPPLENLDSPTREEISLDMENFPPLGSVSLHNDNDPPLEKVIWPSYEAGSLQNDNGPSLDKLETASAKDLSSGRSLPAWPTAKNDKVQEPGDSLGSSAGPQLSMNLQKDKHTSDENSESVPALTYQLKDEKDFPPLTGRGR